MKTLRVVAIVVLCIAALNEAVRGVMDVNIGDWEHAVTHWLLGMMFLLSATTPIRSK